MPATKALAMRCTKRWRSASLSLALPGRFRGPMHFASSSSDSMQWAMSLSTALGTWLAVSFVPVERW
jgi:hypothetical protein